jgi:hypothetical protein
MSEINSNIDLVSSMTHSVDSERPEGWFTVAEFAQRTGMTTGGAKDRLLKLFRAGKIVRKMIKKGQSLMYVYGLPDDTQNKTDSGNS